jgi:hypothetical protein
LFACFRQVDGLAIDETQLAPRERGTYLSGDSRQHFLNLSENRTIKHKAVTRALVPVVAFLDSR